MIKNLLRVVVAMLTMVAVAEAQYYPYPHHPRPFPVPVVPIAPYVYTCNAIGLMNGLITYGIGYDTFTASQRALYVCQSTGQLCQITGCR